MKKTNIEVLDPDAPMEYYKNNYNQIKEGTDVPPHELEAQSLNYQKQYVSGGGLPDALNGLNGIHNTTESDDLFGKLIVNLNSNGALQNETIKQKFKLDLIKDEEDL